MKYVRKDYCRLCKNKNLKSILDLGQSVLANEFVDDPDIVQETYPLELFQCKDCFLFQLLDVVDPELMFKNYLYVSGTSELIRQHFEKYAEDVCYEYWLQNEPLPIPWRGLFVDIGSNDSTLLKQVKGYNVIGVEPAKNLADKSNEEGIVSINDFFNVKTAKEIVANHGKADIITCNNCLAHLDNVDEVVEGVKELIAENGIFVFENAYFGSTFSNNDFSQIYHEHVSYFTKLPLIKYFTSKGMTVYKIEDNYNHGGSIRVFVKNKIENNKDLLDKTIYEEQFINENNINLLIDNIKFIKEDINKQLTKLRLEGKSIVGITASAKSTTFLHYCDIGNLLLDYICDDAKEKQNKLAPGKHIPIKPFSEIFKTRPDYLLILSFNFINAVMKKFEYIPLNWIIPFPEPEIIHKLEMVDT